MPRTVPHLKYFQVLPGYQYGVDASPGSGQPGAVAVWLDQSQLGSGAEVHGLPLGEGQALKGHTLTVNLQVVDANSGMPNVSALVTMQAEGLAPVPFGDSVPTSDGDQVLFTFVIHLV